MIMVHGEVSLAVARWPGTKPPVLYLHAAGFHSRVWRKVAGLVGREAYAADLRGHGDSDKPLDRYRWERFGDDTLAIIDDLALGRPLDAVGHSVGGTALVLAEVASPGTFRRLVLFEPIIYPPGALGPENPMAEGARHRRMVFQSPLEARANFLSKPPMDRWDPEVMDDYVAHGLFERPDGLWELKCSGEVEARIYESALTHHARDQLGRVSCPTVVVRGATTGPALISPAELAPDVARRLRDARLETVDGAGHLLPMEKPEESAQLIMRFLGAP
jgi:pimeloyl-ACP methyl ester carboxylesterase